MSKKSKKKNKSTRIAPKPVSAVAPDQPGAPGPWAGPVTRSLITIVLLGFPFLPWHPFDFLPPVLFWPIYGGMAAACWTKQFKGNLNPPSPVSITLELSGLFLVFGAFLLLKVAGLHASGTDDNIYFYQAGKMAEGVMPYRDFFFSHPPVHILVPALVFKIFGFSIITAKLIPVFAQVFAGLFMYLAVRPSSRVMAFLSLLLQMTAYQVLMGSTDMNGENLLTVFLMASLFTAARGRFRTSGVLAGIGLGCAFYGLAAVIAIALGAAFCSKRAIARYGIGFAAGFGCVMIPFVLLGGADFTKDVFLYHLAKPVRGAGRVSLFHSANPFAMARAFFQDLYVYLGSKAFNKSLYYHTPAYLAAILSMVVLSGRAIRHWWGSAMHHASAGAQEKQTWYSRLTRCNLLSHPGEGPLKLCIIAVVLFVCQYACLNEFYDYYAVPMMGFLAIPAAFFLYRVYISIRDASTFKGFARAGVLVGIFSLHGVWAVHLSHVLWPQEYRPENVGKIVTYDWRAPSAPKALAHLSRTMFFRDHRVRGKIAPYYQHYMWNKRLTFSELARIAAYIRATTKPDDTITGASTIAPLLAMVSGRRMAGDEAETNAKRFITGMLTEKRFFNMICSDHIRYIVSAPRSMFSRPFMETNPFIRDNFRRDREFVDRQLYHHRGYPITLYRRLDIEGLPENRVCGFN